ASRLLHSTRERPIDEHRYGQRRRRDRGNLVDGNATGFPAPRRGKGGAPGGNGSVRGEGCPHLLSGCDPRGEAVVRLGGIQDCGNLSDVPGEHLIPRMWPGGAAERSRTSTSLRTLAP